MDAYLIAIAVIVPVILIAVNFYVLVYYQHPEDKNQFYFPKARLPIPPHTAS